MIANIGKFGLQLAVMILFVGCLLEAAPTDFGEDQCGMYESIGESDLVPIDVVVRDSTTRIACIKAIFALAIKVELLAVDTPTVEGNGEQQQQQQQQVAALDIPTDKADDVRRVLLGYLPLDEVLRVEGSCPNGPQEELQMLVTFGCAKLAFAFRRNETRHYMSSIRGSLELGERKLVQEFAVDRPMFITSDLEHHFKFDRLIEVESEAASTKPYILSANLYFTEVESHRNTTSGDFIRAPDENPKPF